MKKWNFKVESNPKQISTKLESALKPVAGFVFDLNHDKNDSITFKLRKRILYAWYLLINNSIILNGKISKSSSKNDTEVEITFTQHFLSKLIIFTHVFIGLGLLIVILSGVSSKSYFFIAGGVSLGIGILSWFAVQKRFNKNVQEYKTLISDILQ